MEMEDRLDAALDRIAEAASRRRHATPQPPSDPVPATAPALARLDALIAELRQALDSD